MNIVIARARPDDNVEYFRARALQEQVAAAKAKSPEARDRHDELAMIYRFKVAMLSTGPDTWTDSLVDDTKKCAGADVGDAVSAMTSTAGP